AAESRDARPDNSSNDARAHVQLANDVAVSLRNIQIAMTIEPNLVRHVQRRGGGRPTVACMATPPVTGDDGYFASAQIESADSLIVQVAEVQPSVWTNHQTIRVVHL